VVRSLLLLLVALAAACKSGDRPNPCAIAECYADAAPQAPSCDPLAQTGCSVGEKCSWIVDATTPMYVGHVGCAPDGTALVGEVCEFGAAGATGYDDCKKGGVCSAFATPGSSGVCKEVCDNAGGDPMCDATHACVTYAKLFSTGATSPAAAGVCDATCDPLADNDFDGSAGSQTRPGTTCGSNFQIGCYGRVSQGMPPKTAFMCTGDINSNPDKGLRHRAECTAATGCADTDGTIYINSCNQGYEPLLRESTSVSTAVCVAFCKPVDCYAGNCGSNDANRLGAAPHRCMAPDAVGNFGSDEECQYLWAHELDGSGNWLPSAYSDSVGICVDHAAYGWPSCKDVPLHGSGSAVDAVALGCVSSQTAGL
jgi:hypothetical protein